MKVTASGLARLELCPGSQYQPKVVEAPGEWSLRGTALHAYLSAVSQGDKEALSRVPERYREEAKSIDTTAIEGGAYSSEIGFAWDVETGVARRLKSRSKARDYSAATPSELCGTADLVGLTETAVVVWDFKTGWADLGPPEASLQLLAYAVSAAKLYGKENARIGYLFLTPDGQLRPQSAELDEFALLDAEERIKRVVSNTDNTLTVGEHCKYCPALRTCPAQTSMALSFVAPECKQLDTSTAAAAWQRLKAMRRVLDIAEGQLKAYAEFEPFEVAPGKVLGPTEKTVSTYNASRASELAPEVTPYVDQKLTKRAVMECARATKSEGQTLANRVQALEVALAPALETTTRIEVSEHKASHSELEASSG